MVEGIAGKFSLSQLVLNIGAGLGFMGLATLLTELAIDWCSSHKDRAMIKGAKYQEVKVKKDVPGLKRLTARDVDEHDFVKHNPLDPDWEKKQTEVTVGTVLDWFHRKESVHNSLYHSPTKSTIGGSKINDGTGIEAGLNPTPKRSLTLNACNDSYFK